MLVKVKNGKIHITKKHTSLLYKCGLKWTSEDLKTTFRSRKDLLANQDKLCKRCIRAVGGTAKFPCR